MPGHGCARAFSWSFVLTRTIAIFLVVLIQVASTFFFVSDIFSSMIGFRTTPISWEYREMIEIGAAIGLVLGMVLGALALHRALARQRVVEGQLRAASGAFMELLEERFSEWALTPSERDVALFLVKGLSTREIAGLRSTSEGTVKAQTNAIYRKSGVSGRAQLLSLFIDELMSDALVPPAKRPAPAGFGARVTVAGK